MRDTGGLRNGVRTNALWGSGSGKRGNALWGRGGRGIALTALALVTLALPLAAGAKGGRPGIGDATYVAPALLDNAAQDPGHKLHLIIQSAAGTSAADTKLVVLGADRGRRLDLICAGD